MTTTKAELTQTLVNGVCLSRQEAKDMVDAFFAEISVCLASGEGVKLAGFGHFTLRDKSSRPGRNPKTGEPIPVCARRVVAFHASAQLKSNVDESTRSMPAVERRAVAS